VFETFSSRHTVEPMPTLKEARPFAKRILDFCLLIGAALVVCVVGVGAFIVAGSFHVNPLWVFFGFVSVGFVAGVAEEYLKALRSVRFVFFVFGWLLINLTVIVVVVGSVGWLYLIPALLLEQALFYMTAQWLFGLQPPLRR
jgi:hypothetical protein